MTAKYWAGIVATMLAIFVVGSVVARGVKRGKDFVTSSFPIALGMLDNGFRVDGHRLGDVQRMQFMRSTPGQVDSAVLTVRLRDTIDAARFDDCSLEAMHAAPFDHDTRFACSSSADSARLELTPFGHVVLLPEGREVTLFVPRDAHHDALQHAYRGTGSAGAGDVDISASDGHFSMSINGQELVHASGESGKGSLVIRGANGRPIVEINGDSAGGSVKVTDANGKTRVNIRGSDSN